MLVASGRGWSNKKELAVQVIAGRRFRAFALFLIVAAAGASDKFGLYSPDLKAALGYDQTTLNHLSFFKAVGANIEVLSGLIELMPAWVVLLIGAFLNFFSYFMVYLAVTHKISTPYVWHTRLYMFTGAISQSFMKRGSVVTCLKNFPERRGVVLWILKGFVGLSGAILTQFHDAFYSADDTKALILLLGWLPSAISVAFLRTIHHFTSHGHPHELKVFDHFLYISLVLAFFLMLNIIVQENTLFSHPLYGVSAIVLFLLLLPLAVVFAKEYKIWCAKRQTTPEQPKENQIGAQTTQAKRGGREEIRWWQKNFSPLERGQNHTRLQAFSSIDLIILISLAVCGVGGALTATDNFGQIGVSLGYPMSSISTFVKLMSIWNFLGRVFSSFVSEYLLRKYKLLRPLMLALILLLSCVGHLLIALDAKNGLYVAPVITGFSFGVQLALLSAIISDYDLSGLINRSTLHFFGRVGSLSGLYTLSVMITGPLYDKEGMKQLAAQGKLRKEGEELRCVGGDCFRMSFLMITATTFFSALMSLLLVARTWKFYNKIAADDTQVGAVPQESHRRSRRAATMCRRRSKEGISSW